jgi:methionine-rich copper-binding protein CopC
MTSLDEHKRLSLGAAFNIYGANLTCSSRSTQPLRAGKLAIASTSVRASKNLQIGALLLTGAFLFGENPARQIAAAHEKPYSSNALVFSLTEAPTLKFRIPSAAVPAPESRRQQIAHAVMTRTVPTHNGLAPEGLAKVEIWYDSAIRDNMLALAVTNAAGDRVDMRDPKVDAADQTHVFASVIVLKPGKYTVRYRAISVDGFLASGSWSFEVESKLAGAGVRLSNSDNWESQ